MRFITYLVGLIGLAVVGINAVAIPDTADMTVSFTSTDPQWKCPGSDGKRYTEPTSGDTYTIQCINIDMHTLSWAYQFPSDPFVDFTKLHCFEECQWGCSHVRGCYFSYFDFKTNDCVAVGYGNMFNEHHGTVAMSIRYPKH